MEKCCGEVLWLLCGEGCGEVLQGRVVKKCWRRVVGKCVV